MRSTLLPLAVMAAFAAAPAIAHTVHPGPGQVVTGPPDLPSVEPLSVEASNITAADTHSVIAPALPSVDLAPSATAVDYLQAARTALAANETGRTQSALELAETLRLTRSVPLGATDSPDPSPAVHNIAAALRSLAANDVQGTMRLVQQTIPMTQEGQAAIAPAGGPPPTR